MFCPQCKAEYRPSVSVCEDCHVALVPELPRVPGESEDDPFCAFWSGDDPRLQAELCALLDDEGIPYKTVRREDHLFNIVRRPAFQIGVPYSLFEKAETLVKDAFGAEGDIHTLQSGETVPQALLEPAGQGDAAGSENAWDPEEWFPEDATVEVWSGEDPAFADLISSSLRENQIHSRIEELRGKYFLYVLPANNGRAREIVREITEGTPPQ